MHVTTSSSTGGRHAIGLAIQSLLAGWLVLLAGCTTVSGPETPRGYSEKQLGRNVFAVRVPGNAHTSKAKVVELCLLRCAEVAFAHGFSYFVVLQNTNHLATATSSPVNRVMTPLRPESRGLSFIDSELGSPSAANTIVCFRREPSGYAEVYEVEAVFNQFSSTYDIRIKTQSRSNVVDALPLQFNLYANFLFLSSTPPDQIVFLEPGAARRTITIGVLRDWENPCETIEEFKRKAAIAAATLGAQGVQIRSDNSSTLRGGSGERSSFAASLLLIPKARLGLQDEAGAWPRTELVVRGFDQESLAPRAGLEVGDRIVELNGVDVLQEKRFADSWLSWSVGEHVVVTFVRDGVRRSLQAETIAN